MRFTPSLRSLARRRREKFASLTSKFIFRWFPKRFEVIFENVTRQNLITYVQENCFLYIHNYVKKRTLVHNSVLESASMLLKIGQSRETTESFLNVPSARSTPSKLGDRDD